MIGFIGVKGWLSHDIEFFSSYVTNTTIICSFILYELVLCELVIGHGVITLQEATGPMVSKGRVDSVRLW